MRFVDGTKNQGGEDNIHEARELEIFVAVVTALGLSMQEALVYIGINDRFVLVFMECDYETVWKFFTKISITNPECVTVDRVYHYIILREGGPQH